jgi:hypothetical protein
MSVESDLVDTLGALVSDRIYPNTIPQPESGTPEYPAIRYINVATEIDADICGDGNADNVRIQLDIIDNTYAGAMMIRDLTRTAMKSHVSPALLEDSASDYDADTKTHRIRMDYVIYLSSP